MKKRTRAWSIKRACVLSLKPCRGAERPRGSLLRHQLGFARGEFFTQCLQVHLAVAAFGEEFVLLFLHMVLDVFAKHLDLRIEQRLADAHRGNLGDELLGRCVLDFRFIKQIVVFDRAARGGVEDFLFDLRVHRQRRADLRGEFLLFLFIVGLFEFLEPLLDFAMVGLQQFQRIERFGVLPGAAPQVWRVRAPRTPGGQPRPPLTYTLRHHLKQGMTRDEGPFQTTARRVIVHDCFPTALEILLLPLFGPDIVQAFAEISYEDPDNAYVRNERVEARAGQTANVPVRIALMNPERRAFSVRYTFVGANGSVTTGAAFEPDGAIVPWKPA